MTETPAVPGSLVVPDSWWVGRALEHPSAWWLGPWHPEPQGPASFGDLFSAVAFAHVSVLVARAALVPALRAVSLNRVMRPQRVGDAADEYALGTWSGWEQACAAMSIGTHSGLDADPAEVAPLWSAHFDPAHAEDIAHLQRTVRWARDRRARILGDLECPPFG
jgi:hypothetical protein